MWNIFCCHLFEHLPGIPDLKPGKKNLIVSNYYIIRNGSIRVEKEMQRRSHSSRPIAEIHFPFGRCGSKNQGGMMKQMLGQKNKYKATVITTKSNLFWCSIRTYSYWNYTV